MESSHSRHGIGSNFWVKLALLFLLALLVLIPIHRPAPKSDNPYNGEEVDLLKILGLQCEQDPCTPHDIAPNLTQSSIHELETARKLAEIMDEMRPFGNVLMSNSVNFCP